MVVLENTRFKVGDWVIHYYHGVGKVESIVEKGLGKNQKMFYKVTTDDIEYWIPIEDGESDHIEHIRSKSAFNDALKILAQSPKPIGKHHKTRKKRIHDRWRIGSLQSRAELLRDLHGRLKLKKLSFSEKEMLKTIRRYFIDEWLIVDKSLTRKNARKKIRTALKESVKKWGQKTVFSEDK